ncbi:MAG: hypothetical protein EON86_12630 [Brevundimonas sp.]|nr:MAG: hypothetical protein EON86_12630 [Brevundimonas sp.]
MDIRGEARQAGGLMLAGTGASVMLMLHHPTSLKGADDGLLMHDWSNGAVHGGMVVCLLVIALGVSMVPRWLGERHLSVRAGRMLFTGGIAALIVAALVNGFAAERLAGPAAAAVQFPVLAALNQTAAVFGMLSMAAAMALWAVRMLGLRPVAKAAGSVGLMGAVLAVGWLIHGGGAFGLIPAVVATGVFAAWSALTAACLLRVPSEPSA